MNRMFIDEIAKPSDMLNKVVIDVFADGPNAVCRALSPHMVAHVSYLLMHALSPSRDYPALESEFADRCEVRVIISYFKHSSYTDEYFDVIRLCIIGATI
jgi:hypothetical protein